ncbi:hypothetical protein R0K17_24485, partial [Planococcus sp. SIMBA_143]
NSNSSADYLLYRQLKHNQNKGEIQVVDLHEFLRAVHSDYSDPYLPYFTLVDNQLHFKGVSVFKDYKMVRQLTLEESKIFDFLNGRVNYH